uniref:receptor protein-tyrosine kinase n=1 Tax=Strigamia maritima TaxID=126957 RepID=T1JA98_STRMM
MKDKRVISHTHTNKYEILHKEGQSKLIIKHLDGFDTANYTLIAKTNTLEKSITVTLWVKEPPSASIKRTMGYHVANKRYDNSIICNVKGLPLPSVKWWMAECSTIGCTKSFSREIGKSISGNMEKTTKTALDLTSVKSSLSLIAKTSAYYSCEAENSEAENPASAEYLFIVIGIYHFCLSFKLNSNNISCQIDAELINHSGGFGIVTVNSNVLEKDRLTLECLANKFNFTVNLVWKFKKSESDQGVILTNKPGLKITNKQTQYSHGLVAQFESINLQDSGTYVCEAIGYSGNATRKKKINVLEIKAPYILTSNMDGSIYPIHREASFQFICNVTGVPIVTIEWKRDNQTLKETKLVEFNFLHNYTVLEIPRVVTEDSGIYYCVITNRAGRLVLNATLEVEDAILSSGMASQTKAIIISVIVIILILLIIFAAVLARKCYLDQVSLMQDGYLVPMTPDCTQTTAVTTLNSDSVDTSDDSTGFGRLNMSMRATTASKKPLTSFDLIGYAFQTTRGMEYLASRNLIHRDLATRNILLADQNTIKISDFGLTKDCYNKAYYRKKGDAPLPVKWMAIESIRDRVFSTESDVYVSSFKYRIMTECWHSDPNQRPTFPELSDWIGDQLQTGMKEHYMQLNSEYLKLYQLTTANPDYVNMNADNPAPDYVNLATDETEANNSTKPDYLDMRGSNTSSMRAYEASRAAKTELKPMLSQDVPLRSKNSNIEPSVKYSANNTDSIHLMDDCTYIFIPYYFQYCSSYNKIL